MKRVKTDDPNSVEIFINALKNNQIIAYPTDTIYGIGTDINICRSVCVDMSRCVDV